MSTKYFWATYSGVAAAQVQEVHLHPLDCAIGAILPPWKQRFIP